MASTLEVECQICEAKESLIDTQSPSFSHLVLKLEKIINSQEQHRNWLRFMCLQCKAKLDNSWKFQTLCRNAYRKFLDNLEEIACSDNPSNDVKDESEEIDTKNDIGAENLHFSAVDWVLASKGSSTIPADAADRHKNNSPRDVRILRKVKLTKFPRRTFTEKTSGSPTVPVIPKEQLRGPLPTVADSLANRRMQLPTVPKLKAKNPAHKRDTTNIQADAILKHGDQEKIKICDAAKEKNASLIEGIDAKAYDQSFEMIFVPGDIAPVENDSDDSDEEFCKVSSKKENVLPTILTENKEELEVERIISKPAKEEKTERPQKEKDTKILAQEKTLEKVEEAESKTTTSILEKPPVEPTQRKSLKCSLCNKVFRRRNNMRIHIQYVHQKSIQFVCDICGKGFTRKRTYMNHVEIHNEARSRFSCALCNKMFTKKENLKRHIIGIHIDPSKRQKAKRRCRFCRALFRTREEYHEHLRAAHPHPVARSRLSLFSYPKTKPRRNSKPQKSLKCQYCSKECKTGQILEVHERIHTGERPFACEICGKTFRQDQHLKTHMNTHTGANRFQCEYCEKVFTQAGNLRIHRRVHTGEKPYECSTCSKRFPEQKMWKKHSAKCSEES